MDFRLIEISNIASLSKKSKTHLQVVVCYSDILLKSICATNNATPVHPILLMLIKEWKIFINYRSFNEWFTNTETVWMEVGKLKSKNYSTLQILMQQMLYCMCLSIHFTFLIKIYISSDSVHGLSMKNVHNINVINTFQSEYWNYIIISSLLTRI